MIDDPAQLRCAEKERMSAISFSRSSFLERVKSASLFLKHSSDSLQLDMNEKILGDDPSRPRHK
jgi:hypothetical protein